MVILLTFYNWFRGDSLGKQGFKLLCLLPIGSFTPSVGSARGIVLFHQNCANFAGTLLEIGALRREIRRAASYSKNWRKSAFCIPLWGFMRQSLRQFFSICCY